MRRLLYNITVLCMLVMCPSTYASTIYAKISGDTVEWSNAIYKDGEIELLEWQRSDKFQMLPVKRWSPAFCRTLKKYNVYFDDGWKANHRVRSHRY